MELSSLLNQYNMALTSNERTFVNGLKSGNSSHPDEYYEQQIKRLSDAREALKQLPDKKTSDRQSKAEKIKMLKDRLKMLKQMIPFMSASAAKSLKAELRQIAAQIGALKDSSGGIGSIGSSEVLTGSDMQVPTDTDSSGEAEAAAAEATAETADNSDTEQPETDEAPADEAKDKDSSGTENSYLEQANQSKADSAADRADKEELEKLKQLFQSVKQMLERKLQKPNDPATQAALQMQAYQAAAEAIREAGVSIKG